MNEIVVCGQRFDIGTKVVLWYDYEGLNGYETNKSTRIVKGKKKIVKGKRYGKRRLIHPSPSFEQLQNIVTQFFFHHSGLYRARDTFNVLHNERRLSCHFILDDDGVLYQTLDLKEKAWHGGRNNPMSIGIEIDSRALAYKYPHAYDSIHCGKYGVGPRKTALDKVQGRLLTGFEYNDKQYETLIRLAFTLCLIFPKLKCEFPRAEYGAVIKEVLSEPKKWRGFLGHYNAKATKIDPICLDHDRILLGVKNRDWKQRSTFLDLSTWRSIQSVLHLLSYDPGPIDGAFGPKTERAIKEFQNESGLKADGLFGPKTEYQMGVLYKERIYIIGQR